MTDWLLAVVALLLLAFVDRIGRVIRIWQSEIVKQDARYNIAALRRSQLGHRFKTRWCSYRDGDGFPCELLARHDGDHMVID